MVSDWATVDQGPLGVLCKAARVVVEEFDQFTDFAIHLGSVSRRHGRSGGRPVSWLSGPVTATRSQAIWAERAISAFMPV